MAGKTGWRLARLAAAAALMPALIAGAVAWGMLGAGHDQVAVAAGPARAARRAAPVAPPAAAPAAVAPAPAEQGYAIKRVLQIDGPIRIGDYFWDDAGVPAGPVVITVDIAAGTLSIFRAGYEIGTAAILYGADWKPTPTGVFPILAKDAHHVSRTYNNAPMPYTMRLTGDGVSIHGSEMGAGRATHGCIGVPVAFAKRVFAQVKVGDRVIVTNGEMLRQGQRIGAA